jgi:hypothetical protein
MSKFPKQKKKFHQQKKVGIWIDQEKAFIFTLAGEAEPVMEKIKSGVETRNRTAGEREEVTRFGNFIVGEREKKQRRQRVERIKYYKNIIIRILDADYCLVFGPGETKHELAKAIRKDNSTQERVLDVKNSSRLTMNQMKAKIKEFFAENNS